MMEEPNGRASTRVSDPLEDARKRLIVSAQPFAKFDPLTASDEVLREFGIAPPPREEDNPVLHALWRHALSPPVQIRAVRPEDLFLDALYHLDRPEAAQLGATHSRDGSSSNWSGAFIVPNHARRFTWVGGRWNVPTPLPPANAAGGIDDGDYRVSTWIGLDGNYLRSESLPQCGTCQEVKVTNGVAAAPAYSVWFQWWFRTQTSSVVTFDPARYPVAAGDEINGLLAVDAGSATVHILISNHTQAWAAPVQYKTPKSSKLPAVGSTAEWVVERPRSFDPPFDLYPLPDYGHVHFTHCATASAHDPPSSQHPGSLRDARRIRMHLDVTGPPHRSAVISRPEKLGLHALRTAYRSPW